MKYIVLKEIKIAQCKLKEGDEIEVKYKNGHFSLNEILGSQVWNKKC